MMRRLAVLLAAAVLLAGCGAEAAPPTGPSSAQSAAAGAPSAADTAAAVLDGSAEAHPYYVRTAAPDDFLRSVTADDWGAGVITGAVNTCDMLAWARRQLAVDPSCFIAGIR